MKNWRERLIEVRDKVIPEIREQLEKNEIEFCMEEYVLSEHDSLIRLEEIKTKQENCKTSACLAGWIGLLRPNWYQNYSTWKDFSHSLVGEKVDNIFYTGDKWDYLFGSHNTNSIDDAEDRLKKLIDNDFQIP